MSKKPGEKKAMVTAAKELLKCNCGDDNTRLDEWYRYCKYYTDLNKCKHQYIICSRTKKARIDYVIFVVNRFPKSFSPEELFEFVFDNSEVLKG